jgi:RNA polymerase sigma factor (sigma-70 family)
MVSRHRGGGVLQDVRTLFDSGTTVGLTDGELLGRFADRAGWDRIADDASEPAFAALVERHGPMVLRVCRSILRDEHDAQDAFQATFLVLVRRAGSVRRQGSVGSWLHGVALRVSARARADLARRRRHERRAGEIGRGADRSDSGESSPEVAAILHEELGRLPERYRAAVVLCYLEGHTCEAAARRLGRPVGTVKSRLARGRKRLRGRLIRRGLGPVETSGGSSRTPAVLLPAALARSTVEAMLRFAAGRPTAGAASPAALSWTLRALTTMQVTRLAIISVLLIAGLAATGAAIWISQDQRPDATRSAALSKAPQKTEPAKPAGPEKKEVERLSVRVVDTKGRGVPGVEVEVIEEDAAPAGDGPGYRMDAYRTGADGRFRITADARFRRLTFEARPDDRTMGWASLHSGEAWPKATDEDPIPLKLLSRNHPVEGTVVDTRGNPIRGVLVWASQFDHDANRFAHGHPRGDGRPSLASAVTDEAGRYRLSLPEGTTAIFRADHPWYVGESFSCKPDSRTIAPAVLEDAGGIAGTVVDAATGRPVAGTRVGADRIEHTERILYGKAFAVSDAQGRFRAGGLAPGVYNLLFASSPKGRRFTARAIQGVRVKAGEDAPADLRMIEGRRLHGTAVIAETGQPLVGAPIFCYSASHPRSGAACQGTYTDKQGHFEHFVPPGPALVYIALPGLLGSEHRKALEVSDDRDPDPVILKRTDNPNAKAFRGVPRIVECEVRVRVKTDVGDRRDPEGRRTLSGRVFDKGGSPLPGVQVYYNRGRTFIEGATDRLGLFRLKGLPLGPSPLELRRDGEERGRAAVPAEAVEIDLIFP